MLMYNCPINNQQETKAAALEFDQAKLFPLCVGILVVILPFVIIIYAKIRDKRKQEEEQSQKNQQFNFEPNEEISDD